MNKKVDLDKVREDAIYIFHNGYACSESVIYAIQQNVDPTITQEEIAMSSGFPWGLNAGSLCGALAGGTMSLGHVFGRKELGADNELILDTTKELHDHFLATNGETHCGKLIEGMDPDSAERKEFCTEMVADAAVKVATLIMENRQEK